MDGKMDRISQLIQPLVQDLGGFQARRSLPHDDVKMVGPFIFFDHLGVAEFAPGEGVDVRPHPHINLATVTYLFEGVLLHRDSLGFTQEIRPGAVNWMTAGKGIVHSERSPQSDRDRQITLHGIQTWVALPDREEEVEPSFVHYPAAEIPSWSDNGVKITLITGEANEQKSPVKTRSPIIYLDLVFSPGGSYRLSADYSERAVYTVTSGISVDGEELPQHRLVILKEGSAVAISSESEARCVVVGGEPVGERYKWWNFVSSRPARIERAKQDWQAGNFDKVPDETEFIPLPESAQNVKEVM